jgi:hypothetical protein
MEEEYCSKCFSIVKEMNPDNAEVESSTMVKYKDTVLCFGCFEKIIIEEKSNGKQ